MEEMLKAQAHVPPTPAPVSVGGRPEARGALAQPQGPLRILQPCSAQWSGPSAPPPPASRRLQLVGAHCLFYCKRAEATRPGSPPPVFHPAAEPRVPPKSPLCDRWV